MMIQHGSPLNRSSLKTPNSEYEISSVKRVNYTGLHLSSSRRMNLDRASSSLRVSKSSDEVVVSTFLQENTLLDSDTEVRDRHEIPAALSRLVKFTPEVIEFTDVFENEKYITKFKIQNIGTKLVTFRVKKPPSSSFTFNKEVRSMSIPAGMSVEYRLELSYTLESPSYSYIPIKIEDIYWEMPIFVSKGHTMFRVEPQFIDFGKVNVYSPPIITWLTIFNDGHMPGRFSVDAAANNLNINAFPNKGRIKAHDQQQIKLQLSARNEGQFASELWVIGDQRAVRVEVQVNVITPQLCANHPNTTGDFTLLDFPATFQGAMRYETIAVRNNSAEPATFIVLAEIRNELLDLKMSKKRNNNYNMFSIEPSEGRIESDESRIFTITFEPVEVDDDIRTSRKAISKQTDYLCFLKILIVQVVDLSGAQDLKEYRTESVQLRRAVSKSEGLRLCIHGTVVIPDMTIVPDGLTFLDLSVNEERRRVLRLTNNSSIGFSFNYIKAAFIEVKPSSGSIQPDKSTEVEIIVQIKSLGDFKRRFYFELFSPYNMTDKEGVKSVGKSWITVTAQVKTKTTVPLPKLNTGITPLVTNEVGFLAEEVTFSSKVEKPRNAIVPVGGKVPRLHSRTALIAFPNDMPRTLMNHRPNKETRTIFTGAKRYDGPIDSEMTYTLNEKLKKDLHNFYYLQYMREMAQKLLPPVKPKIVDYELSCKTAYQYTNYRPQPIIPPTPKAVFDKSGLTLVPLTPLQLYNIKVKPRELDFEKVAVNTDCEELMWVENLNSFLVLIRILPGLSGVHIHGQDKIKVEAMGTGAFKVVLHTDTLGKYNGSFQYIINENHLFEMPVRGEIVQKTLVMEPEEVHFMEEKENVFYTWSQFVKLSNPLKTETEFKWELPDSYKHLKIHPRSGVVPRLSMIYCSVCFIPSSTVETQSRVTLKIESGITFVLKCFIQPLKPDIHFINPTLNVGMLPVKLPTSVKTVMFNSSYKEVPFEIAQHCLTSQDIQISPVKGFIKPRSCVIFTVVFTVSNIGHIDKTYNVHSYETITELRVIGEVIYPNVLIMPREIRLLRVRLCSYVSSLLTAENVSEAAAKLSFPMEKFMQFKISLSPRYWEEGLSSDGFLLKPGQTQKFYIHVFPEDLTTYEFYLPVKINDLIGPPMYDSPQTLKPLSYLQVIETLSSGKLKVNSELPERLPIVFIECTVAPAIVLFNKVNFNFQTGEKLEKLEDTFLISVPEGNPQVVIFIAPIRFKSPFQLISDEVLYDTEKGSTITLDRGKSVEFTVRFVPYVYGIYEENIPIYIRDIRVTVPGKQLFTVPKTPYNFLRLHGIHHKPKLLCTSSVVYFPCVPLQVEAIRTLNLMAIDYREEDEAIIELPVQYNELDLIKITFVDGNLIGARPKSIIPFNVTFTSPEPVTISLQVLVKDRSGTQSSFVVYASSDNCILSTHAFLATKTPYTLNRIKFIDAEYMDALANSLRLTNSISTYSQMKVDSCSKLKTSLSNDNFSSQTDENAMATSVTTSLLLKQSIPARLVTYFAIQDYSDGTDYTTRVIKSVEKFLYEQTFHCSFYWEIGTNIKWSSAFNPAEQGAAAKHATLIKSLIEVLEKCYGKDIRTKFAQANIVIPKDPVGRVLKVASTLDQVLNFLRSQGAFVTHIEAKYLLDFEDYILYIESGGARGTESLTEPSPKDSIYKSITPAPIETETNAQLNIVEFNNIKIQCWLDVFLQLYKVLVLKLLPMHKRSELDREKSITSLSELKGSKKYNTSVFRKKSSTAKTVNRSSVTQVKINSNTFSKAEAKILSWLSYHYNKRREVIWRHDAPDVKAVNNFSECFEDCLIFAAVTSAYCPYITDIFFTEMYTHPKSKEEKLHNAVCLTRAWQSIRLGFTVHPYDFVNYNCVHLLMISVHLVRVLPSYLPETVVKFETPLTTDTEHIISVLNNANSRVAYTIHIVGDPYQYFNITNFTPMVMLKSKEKCSIKVKYSAKKISKVTATLLLCGTCISPFFGANRTYSLEGTPSELQISLVFNLVAPLNRLIEVSLPIVCPYLLMVDTEYVVWYTEKKPTTIEHLEVLPWQDVGARKAPRRLFVKTPVIGIPPFGGQTNLDIKISCFTPKPRSFWLLFVNDHSGDFLAQVTIKSNVKEVTEPLHVEPLNKIFTECTCFSIHQGVTTPSMQTTFRSKKASKQKQSTMTKKEKTPTKKPTATQGDKEKTKGRHQKSKPKSKSLADKQNTTQLDQEVRSKPESELKPEKILTPKTWNMLLSPTCPRKSVIKIPCRNVELWVALKHMFELTLDPSEKEFWSSHLETNIGLKLVQWMVGDEVDSVTEEINHIYQTAISYSVTCPSEHLNLPSTIDIPDVRLYTTVDLPVHVSENAPDTFVTKLTLVADHKRETRIYKVKFAKLPNSEDVL